MPEWWVLQCDCKTFITDYPFIAECKGCGRFYAGSKEQLEEGKKNGMLMDTLKTGFGWPNVTALMEELGVDIKVEMVNWPYYEPNEEDYYDDDPELEDLEGVGLDPLKMDLVE